MLWWFKQINLWKHEKINRRCWDSSICWIETKIYSFFVDNNDQKKAKGVYKYVAVTISHDEYKDVSLNNKCTRQSVNRTQRKDHRIGTYQINKISLSCFDDKIHIPSNECDGLMLSYQS